MASTLNASNSGAGGLISTADASGVLQLQSAGTTAVTIDTSQNVGIGTTSPNGKFESYANSGYSVIANSSAGSVAINPSSNAILFGTTNVAAYATGNYDAATHVYKTSGTERMRIDSSGNVGIGTSSPTYKLDISSGSSNTLNITTANANTTIFNITRTSVTTVTHTLDNTGYKIINGGSGGLYLGYTGTSWTSLSDERFKTDLKPIENAIEKVSALRAVTGRFKTDNENKSRAFLIAQDIQAVLPEAVDTSNPEQLGVSYTDTIPLLVAAIKEQQTIINDLKARIETLEGAA